MWGLLGRNKTDWHVKILGSKESHRSINGLKIETHGRLAEANKADFILFSSGKGSRVVMHDQNFLNFFSLDPKKKIIGSICSGALILAKLGLLENIKATTHPRAKLEFQTLGIEVIDKSLVSHGNIATAGGCLSAMYLVGWVVEKLFGEEKRREILKGIIPVGEEEIYNKLISSSLMLAQSPLQENG